MADDIEYHKQEVQMVRREKDSLEQVLAVKAQEVRTSLQNEAQRVEEDLKNSLNKQRNENIRLMHAINKIKEEKTNLQKNLLSLQQRIAELETQIGTN